MADLDGLLPTAIEEMLRYTSPVVNFRRTAMEDTVLRDQPIAAGDKLMVFYGSANRDEDVFADPDRFDVGRSPNPHMAFGGGGPHLCLGLHVARIEIAVMLRELLDPDARPGAGRRAGAPGVELHRRRAHDAGVVHARRPLTRVPAAGPPRSWHSDGRKHSDGARWVGRASAEGGDDRGEGLDLGGRAVEVEGDDRPPRRRPRPTGGSGRCAPRPCRRRRA